MNASSNISILALLFCIISFLLPPAISIGSDTNNMSNKELDEAEKLFGSGPQEEDYWRTDRLLLTATKKAIDARKAPAISTVVSEQEIRDMGARSLLDILKRVPGLAISISELPTKNAIEVRGVRTKNTEKILFMINGHRMNNNLTGSAINIMDDLSVENIKRVEIIRGPGSALYGANAFIAVINVVTKSGEDFEGVRLTAGGGSFATQHYNLQAGHEGDTIQAFVFFDYFDTDGPSSLIEKDAQTFNDANHNTSASLAPGNTLEWQKKKDFGLTLSYKDISFHGRVIDKEKGPYIGVGRALNDETVQRFHQISGELNYEKKFKDVLDISARIHGDKFDWDTYWEVFPEGFAGAYSTGYIGNPITTNQTLGAELSSTYLFNEHLLTIGVNFEKVKQTDTQNYTNFANPGGPAVNTTTTSNFNKDVDRHLKALYAQDVWQIQENLSLTLGVRIDDYSDFGSTTNPRFGLVWQPLEKFTIKALYGSAFRPPTFTEQYTKNNPSEIGNENLNPENIDTFELSTEYSFTKIIHLQLNYFKNEIEDLITLGSKPSPTEPAPYVNKPGTTTINGLEMSFRTSFAKKNLIYANLSYQQTKDLEGNALPDVADWKGNLGFNYELCEYLNINGNLNWIGERPRAEKDTREGLESVTTVDVTTIISNIFNSLELRASVYNLFDEEYRDPSPNNRVPNDYPSNGRTFLVEVRYSF